MCEQVTAKQLIEALILVNSTERKRQKQFEEHVNKQMQAETDAMNAKIDFIGYQQQYMIELFRKTTNTESPIPPLREFLPQSHYSPTASVSDHLEQSSDPEKEPPNDGFPNVEVRLEEPAIVSFLRLENIALASQYQINDEGDILGVDPSLWLGFKLIEKRNERESVAQRDNAQLIRFFPYILNCGVLDDAVSETPKQKKFAVVAFFFVKTRQLYFVISRLSNEILEAEVFPILSGVDDTYERPPDIRNDIKNYLARLHNDLDIIMTGVKQYRGSDDFGSLLPGFMQKSLLPHPDDGEQSHGNNTSVFIIRSRQTMNVAASLSLVLARFLVVSMDRVVGLEDDFSAGAEDSPIPSHFYNALSLDSHSCNQELEKMNVQGSLTNKILRDRDDKAPLSIHCAFYVSSCSLHYLLIHDMVFGNGSYCSDEDDDDNDDDSAYRKDLEEWKQQKCGQLYAQDIVNANWTCASHSHEVLDFDTEGGQGETCKFEMLTDFVYTALKM